MSSSNGNKRQKTEVEEEKKKPVVKSTDKYEHPLVSRYSSLEMSKVWSPQKKFSSWRELWVALATAEKELGLNITDEQLKLMADNVNNIDFEYAKKEEKKLRHDVMAHIHTFGHLCPEAAGIIHLGATSCFVTDNGELVQIKESLMLVQAKLLKVISLLTKMAEEHKSLPTLGFTHYQPAQLTTVGKRCTLWLQDFIMDFHSLKAFTDALPFRGVKGTTGTQASFLSLFDGDHDKVKKLNARVTELMKFDKAIGVSGQTYTRKLDFQMCSILSGIAQSAHKMATDIRLLANLKEIEEPFEKSQVGSSAMAYKRNPMRSERICSIARYVMSLTANTAHTHAVQWFERTLDDSANRRMVLPEAFLAVDGILNIATNVVDGMQIWPMVIRKHVMAELPFMATENILMACVKAGADRQVMHEAVRELSMEAGKRVKEEGADNDLLTRIAKDDRFKVVHATLDSITDPTLFVGRAPEQVDEFISEAVTPLLKSDHSIKLLTSLGSDVGTLTV